ncbi:transcriptional regulator, LuxR family [Stackebrandtia nassauensis DSM 44728]|uniref:Transcriptional regulator, LuxR family n=1 Tax=Stackebrandtia nassauensis (strain DSM 44728 / CIP 108903 / NRRL B-16338 / NBRC 102104 / LLR-40K-21) TaxID=446470 RepID=D3QBY0_STANL|nr:transcriptional regulator, LuxR family [Stackebrandtia nassauensis DSM 44728]
MSTLFTPDLRNPVVAWEVIARSAVHIVREARASRRLEPLSIDGRMLFKAVAALGIDLEPPKPTALRTSIQRGLSARESQVLLAIASGKSNAEIGRELFITEDTVKTHARRMYRKLGARDRAHAVAEAFRVGILT